MNRFHTRPLPIGNFPALPFARPTHTYAQPPQATTYSVAIISVSETRVQQHARHGKLHHTHEPQKEKHGRGTSLPRECSVSLAGRWLPGACACGLEERRYLFYLLYYWYESTNTDAARRRHHAFGAPLSKVLHSIFLPFCCVEGRSAGAPA